MRLPDAVFEQLRHLLAQKETLQWAVGDFIIDVWVEIERYTDEHDRKTAHAEMIWQMAKNTGADKSTLRRAEKISNFFPKESRKQWQPPFTYHQLRALMTAGEDWEDIAGWALDGGYNGGVATIDEIRDKIRGEISPNDLCRKRLDALDGKIRVILDDLTTPADVIVALSLIPDIIQDARDLIP